VKQWLGLTELVMVLGTAEPQQEYVTVQDILCFIQSKERL
jgi:hypothetical protein